MLPSLNFFAVLLLLPTLALLLATQTHSWLEELRQEVTELAQSVSSHRHALQELKGEIADARTFLNASVGAMSARVAETRENAATLRAMHPAGILIYQPQTLQ